VGIHFRKTARKSCLPTGIFRGGFCLVGRIPHPLLGEPKPLTATTKNIFKILVLFFSNFPFAAVVVSKGRTSPFPSRRKGGEPK